MNIKPRASAFAGHVAQRYAHWLPVVVLGLYFAWVAGTRPLF